MKDGREPPKTGPAMAPAPDEQQRLLHELRQHQVELELQNEELRAAQAALELSRTRYRDLYDRAPVGYCTIADDGSILEANMKAAGLLGVPRSALVGQPLTRFIQREDQDAFYLWRRRHFACGGPEAGAPEPCELQMVTADGTSFWAHVEAAAAEHSDGAPVCRMALSDVTERRARDDERELTARLLLLVNNAGDLHGALAELTLALQGWSRCEAVGVRLRDGDDFPYYETRGFPPEFVRAENHLCAPGPDGGPLRDATGSPVLDCMCGNVLRGRFDPAKPFFTARGSFWTNGTTALLASTTEADRQARTRNRCNGEGYESVALVPLRAGSEVLGLLQFNDRRRDRFTPSFIAHLERMADHLAVALSRRQAAEALRSSEALYRVLAETMKDVVWILDAESMTFRYVSPSVERLRGYTAAEVLANPLDHALTTAAGAAKIELIRSRAAAARVGSTPAGTFYTGEVEQPRKDGSTVWTEVVTSYHVDPVTGRVDVHGVTRDISERRRAEASLREREEMYRALVAGLPDLVVRFDPAARHLFVSENVSNWVDLTAAQVVGKTHRELGFPEARCRFWEQTIGEVVAGAAPLERELTLAGRDGPVVCNLRLVPERDAGGAVRSVLAILRDVTAHRRVEEDYRTLFREMLDGFALHEIICDAEGRPTDYRFLAVNPAFERMTGLVAADVVGKTVREVLPSIEQRWIETYGAVALTGEPASFESYTRSMGKWFLVTAFRPAPGQFACVFADVTERKQAEAALRASEDLLNEVGRIARVGGWEMDLLTRRATWTRATYDIVGLEPGAPAPGPDEHLAYYLEEDRPLVAEALRALVEDDAPLDFQARSRLSSGEVRWFRALGRADRKDGRAVRLYGTLQDVTERKRAEDALRASEAATVALLDATTDAAALLSPGGTFLAANREMARRLGVMPEELLGTSMFERLPPEVCASRQVKHEEAVRTRRPLRFEDRRGDRWIECSVYPLLDARGDVNRVAVFGRDVTEERRATAALLASEQRLRDIAANLPGAVFQFLVRPDGSRAVPYMSAGGERLLGRPLAELTDSERFFDVLHPDDAAAFEASVDEAAATGSRWTREFRVVKPDGSVAWIRGSSNPRPLPDGGTLWDGVLLDVTDRRLAEEANARLEAQLQQSQKMESVGRLAGGVAHDFNNMLGVILGQTELALEQVAPTEPLHADLVDIRDAALRSADLTRQLLAFARKQVVAPRELDLNATVQGMLGMLRRLVGEDLQLDWKPAADLWPVRVDPSQVDQILANLCANARDAINGVGRVTIETATCSFDERACAEHAGYLPGDFVRLAVTDDGCGMDGETLSHLFEPFFTTKAMGKGTGLGLATVYGRVRQNDGFVAADSRPGLGTTISVYLPRYVGRAAEAWAAAPVGPPPMGRETVLLVEDEPAILRLATRQLTGLGYQVLSAGTPGEALAVARAHAGEVHLLVTDVVMPEMNGRDLAKSLLALYPDLRRLFMSGYTADVIAHRGVLDEGVHFLQKPFTAKDLATKVREALDRR